MVGTPPTDIHKGRDVDKREEDDRGESIGTPRGGVRSRCTRSCPG